VGSAAPADTFSAEDVAGDLGFANSSAGELFWDSSFVTAVFFDTSWRTFGSECVGAAKLSLARVPAKPKKQIKLK